MATSALFLSAIIMGWFLYPAAVSSPLVPEHVPLLPTALHNLLIIVFLGAGGLLLAVPTVLVAAWNAFLAGALFATVADQPIWWISLSIHGLPELAGQFCGTVSGLKVAASLIRTLAHDHPFRLASPLRWFGLALVLTLLAAVLEWGVSPLVAHGIS
jgi:uncharacterized membrane protein SpoIIM required for sporulation